MRVCISASGNTLDSLVNARFGRCPYFILADPDTLEYEVVPNPAQQAVGGAGIQGGQWVANQGIQVVLTGRVGPNAQQIFAASGIKVAMGVEGTVRGALEAFKAGRIVPQKVTPSAMVPGFGPERGRGRWMGRAWPPSPGYEPRLVFEPEAAPGWEPPPPEAREEEIAELKEAARGIAEQLRQIQARLRKLEKNAPKYNGS